MEVVALVTTPIVHDNLCGKEGRPVSSVSSCFIDGIYFHIETGELSLSNCKSGSLSVLCNDRTSTACGCLRSNVYANSFLTLRNLRHSGVQPFNKQILQFFVGAEFDELIVDV